MLAAGLGHLVVVQVLLQAGAEVDAADSSGWTPLLRAARRGHVEVMNGLLAAGADINATDRLGWTSLLRAARNGDLEAVNSLLKAGTHVDAQNSEGNTALMLASVWGQVEVVDILLKTGVDVDVKNGANPHGADLCGAKGPGRACLATPAGGGRLDGYDGAYVGCEAGRSSIGAGLAEGWCRRDGEGSPWALGVDSGNRRAGQEPAGGDGEDSRRKGGQHDGDRGGS